MFKSQLRSKEDILAIRSAEEEYAKRTLVAQENLKLVREELTNCYVEHGVNHKIACKGLREEYAALVRDPTHGAGQPVSRMSDGYCHVQRGVYDVNGGAYGDLRVVLLV